MKKHHLFLLIVCLLLVASLAFPIPLPRSTNHSIIYEVSDINDFPGKIVEGDTLYIKKFMDQVSEKENKQIKFTISKKTIDQKAIPISFDDTTVWLKGSVDEVAEEYYASPPLSPGTYVFLVTSTRTSGHGTLEKPSVISHQVEVIPKKNLVEVQKIREGDNHT